MEGIKRKNERELDADIWRAWTVAAMSGAAQAGKLKPLNNYLRKPRKQTPDEMLVILREFQARGAAMKITKIER